MEEERIGTGKPMNVKVVFTHAEKATETWIATSYAIHGGDLPTVRIHKVLGGLVIIPYREVLKIETY